MKMVKMKDNKFKKSAFLFTMLLLFSFFSFSLVSAVMTITLTTPASNTEMGIGSSQAVLMTVDSNSFTPENVTSCALQYLPRGSTSFSTFATINNISVNNMTFRSSFTVPNCFGSAIKVRAYCSNSTLGNYSANNTGLSCKNYEASEIPEVAIDLVMTVGALLVGFGALVGLILLYGWVKTKI